MAATIVIVDDQEVYLSLLEEYLHCHGYTILKASSADAAIAILEQQKVDLLLTDVVMPGKDGMSVVKAIRASQPEVPVIVMTGFTTAELETRFDDNGVYCVLQKPIKLRDLLVIIEDLITKKKPSEEEAEVKWVQFSWNDKEQFVAEVLTMLETASVPVRDRDRICQALSEWCKFLSDKNDDSLPQLSCAQSDTGVQMRLSGIADTKPVDEKKSWTFAYSMARRVMDTLEYNETDHELRMEKYAASRT